MFVFYDLIKQFYMLINHCVRRDRIQSYYDPHFPAFGLNTERYRVSLGIKSKYRKMRAMRENAYQNNSEYGHFSRSEWFLFSSLDRRKSGCVRRESWRTFRRKEKKLDRIYSLLVDNLVVSLLFCLNLSLYFFSHHISTEAVTEGVP